MSAEKSGQTSEIHQRWGLAISNEGAALYLVSAVSVVFLLGKFPPTLSWLYLGIVALAVLQSPSTLPIFILFSALLAHTLDFGTSWLTVAYPALLISYVVGSGKKLAMQKGDRLLSYLSLILAFTTITIVSSLLTSNSVGVGHLVVTSAFLLMLGIYQVAPRDPATYPSIIWKGIFAYAIILMISVLPELGDVGRRLAIEGNVRVLANGAGLALTVLLAFAFVFAGDRSGNSVGRLASIVILFIIVFMMTLLLLMTQSRGVLASAAIGLGGVAILSIATYLARLRLSAMRLGLVIVLCWIIAAAFYFGVQSGLIGHFIYRRLATFLAGGDGGIRFDIWRAAVDGMSSYQLLIGAGPASFQSLARGSGMDFYAHSVFVDVFVSYGAIGFMIFFLIIIAPIMKAVEPRCLVAIAVFSFTIIAFSTHGTSTSANFWAGLMIAAGLFQAYTREQRLVPL